jgi:threonylcarbamoyladenosine tRNA methylthiotransferase MtaB
MRKRTFAIVTFGCKVNQYESQSIRERCIERGMLPAGAGVSPDLCLVNTCTVTSTADRKSRAAARMLKRRYPGTSVVLTGCLVENECRSVMPQKLHSQGLLTSGKGQRSSPPGLAVCGGMPGDPCEGSKSLPGVDYVVLKRFFPERISGFCGHTRAFLKIQDGCDNRCAYCRVALVRGPLRSIPLHMILDQAKSLVAHGVKEIVLTGICLGKYGAGMRDPVRITRVLKYLEAIPGLARIRLSSIELSDVTADLIAYMASSAKTCPHLHIPLQSGDAGVLTRMNRRYTPGAYFRTLELVRRKIENVCITTDVIVGFPGETRNAFVNTVKAIREACPLRTHVFPFSPRPGTAAFGMADRTAKTEVSARMRAMILAGQESGLLCAAGFTGRRLPVLFEHRGSEDALWHGYASNYLKVRVESVTPLENVILDTLIGDPMVSRGEIECAGVLFDEGER